MKNLIALLCVVLIASCATKPTSQPINLTEKTLIDFPEQGIIVTASLGDRLVAKGYKEEGPAYELSAGELVPIKGNGWINCAITNTFSQTKFVQRKTPNGDLCAGPFFALQTIESGQTDWGCKGTPLSRDICFSKSNNNFYINSDNNKIKEAGIDRTLIKKIIKTSISTSNFIQEFIYNGKVDNNIKFIYREFSGDMIRPAFNQSVQYDYNDSKFISFKGLNIEIIEANNQRIKYKMLSNF